MSEAPKMIGLTLMDADGNWATHRYRYAGIPWLPKELSDRLIECVMLPEKKQLGPRLLRDILDALKESE